MSMILHCGAYKVDRRAVTLVDTPAPEGNWVPVPHDTLLTEVEKVLAGVGAKIVSESHALAKDGARYFGMLQVGSNGDDYGMIIGVRNSHDREFAAGLVLGSRIFVCDNLGFSGEVKLARKHTRYIMRDLPGLTSRAVGLLMDKRVTVGERFDSYKSTPLEYGPDASHLLVRSIEAGVIAPSKLRHIMQSWKEPEHPDFAADWNVWRLYNAFSERWKGDNPFDLPKRCTALHGILDPFCEFGADNGEAIEAEYTDVTVE